MTLQQLQYIVALDTHRHFVRAANSCFVAQPTLTLQVQKLEEEIKLSLFDRSSKPMRPTDAGEAFIAKAREILKAVEDLKSMVNDEKETLTGTFSLGIIPTLAPYLLPLFLKAFKTEHPGVQLEVREMQSALIIDALNKGRLDIGIMATPLNESAIRELPLFNEPFMLYTNDPRHEGLKAATEADLYYDGLWLLNQGHCFRNQVMNLCGADRTSAIEGLAFESGSIETLKNLVRSSGGYTLIPELSYQPQTDESFIRPFSVPVPSREISIVVHRSFTKELLLQHLKESILKGVPDQLEKNERVQKILWR